MNVFARFAALSAFGTLAQAAMAEELAGYDRMQVNAPHRGQLIDATIWYPAAGGGTDVEIGKNPVFHGVLAAKGATLRTGQFPLVLLSHGSGGNMDNLGWLSSRLVERGAIVLAVNHPGSTSGDSDQKRTLRYWERPMDLSSALDQLLERPSWAETIDMDRIYSIGFSYGGGTVMQMAGLQVDLNLYADYCDANARALDCQWYAAGGADIRAAAQESELMDLTDARIARTAAVDPALGYAMTEDSIAAFDHPLMTLMLGADRPTSLDVSDAGSGLATRINATYHEIAQAGHCSFLGLCKGMAPMILRAVGEDPICTDPAGADRAAIHEEAAAQIAGFFGLDMAQPGS